LEAIATALIEIAFAALLFTKESGAALARLVPRSEKSGKDELSPTSTGCMAAGTKKGSDAALLRLPSHQEGLDCAVQHGDGVAVLLPFLGVSSLNFGPLSRAALFSWVTVLSTTR
jgi:hypothetical protein